MNIVSGILFFVAFLPYVWAILHGQTVPSPVSWFIWASTDTLTLMAMRKEDATRGQLTGAVAGAWLITLLAIMFGKPTIGLIEWASIIGACAGIVLWKRTGNPVTAIVCSQAAVFIGAIPTIVGAYAYPSQEDPLAWIIWFLSCVCALLAIRKERWTLVNALQPLTFTAIETIMVALVVIRPLMP